MSKERAILKHGREKAVRRGHPWIFSGAIHNLSPSTTRGDIVTVESSDGSYLGRGHYEGGSLAIKLLTQSDEAIDQSWFDARIQSAFKMRQQLGLPSADTNCFRLVHGEGDWMPGLIVDVYKHVAVVQPHSMGMERSLDLIVHSLQQLDFIGTIVWKPTDNRAAQMIQGDTTAGVQVLESGNRYEVDVIHGQKTGFFLDQRDSRHLLQSYTSGAKVLNCFSYTGGFSVAALAGGARSIVSVDGSEGALSLAETNVKTNFPKADHQVLKLDAVKYLESLDQSWDVIVLDPPAFAKHKSARNNALRAYRRINEAALGALKNGGILFTFSCSQIVDRQLFYDMVLSASINIGRPVQVLHHLRQPADHPVSIFHPEGEYLKGLALRVG